MFVASRIVGDAALIGYMSMRERTLSDFVMLLKGLVARAGTVVLIVKRCVATAPFSGYCANVSDALRIGGTLDTGLCGDLCLS